MPTKDSYHIAMFEKQFLPDSSTIVHCAPRLFADAISLRAPPVFPVMQRTVTIQIGVCIQYDKLIRMNTHYGIGPLQSLIRRPEFQIQDQPIGIARPEIYEIVIQCLSICTTSPIALPLIAGKRKILVGHCSVMYVRKLTGFTANIVISPYDRIRYSCLADTMKSFLHIRPFHRRIILCQISHLEHGIYFLTVGNQPVHLRIEDLRTLLQISLRIRQYHKSTYPTGSGARS